MTCQNCSHEIPQDALFCPVCGTMTEQQPFISQEILTEQESRFITINSPSMNTILRS